MNAFAALLLSFPFYLATKGRLHTYVDLAKPGSPSAANAPSDSSSPSILDAAIAPGAAAMNAAKSLMDSFK